MCGCAFCDGEPSGHCGACLLGLSLDEFLGHADVVAHFPILRQRRDQHGLGLPREGGEAAEDAMHAHSTERHMQPC